VSDMCNASSHIVQCAFVSTEIRAVIRGNFDVCGFNDAFSMRFPLNDLLLK
jgi:hypothetical protein